MKNLINILHFHQKLYSPSGLTLMKAIYALLLLSISFQKPFKYLKGNEGQEDNEISEAPHILLDYILFTFAYY